MVAGQPLPPAGGLARQGRGGQGLLLLPCDCATVAACSLQRLANRLSLVTCHAAGTAPGVYPTAP